MIKIVFTDVDGTLLDGIRGFPYLSAKNQYAIKALLEKGIYVVISSGRSKSILNKEIVSLNPNGYILCNGAYIELNNKPIQKIVLSKEDVKYIKDLTLTNNGILLYENQEGAYADIRSKCPLLEDFITEWNMPSLKIQYKENFDEEVYKVANVFPTTSDFDKFTSSIDNRIDIRRQKGLLAYDIVPKGMSKGNAIKQVLDTLHISNLDALAFGDNVNDIEMLEAVGTGVAMGNACEELKKVADDVTDDAINDGFYKYLVSHQIIEEE